PARGTHGPRRCPRRRDGAAAPSRGQRQELAKRGPPRLGRVRRPQDSRGHPRRVRQLLAGREAGRAGHARPPARPCAGTDGRGPGAGAARLRAADTPAEIVRQLRGFQDAVLDKQIADLWGAVRETPAERKALITEWKRKLATVPKTPADVNLGRAVFAKTCLNC